ncbi:uncharacterized protein LOC129726942 isoform X3 [Wyeomyia smithii]|uniref:uncharacterized protein LOC129726942 isoform X3 n=1 Tax=Wyeomyia smithii TaxID=174621 RepID=UPI002467FA11|nr:uncharacterized protein LOC129726942 isoform X3 [Wyeomyia smithii]
MNLNFMLTEISLQLLDNTFFDMYGQSTDNMKDLFTPQSSTVQLNNGQKRQKKSSDLLSCIGIANFEDLQKDCGRYVDSQYRGFVDNLQARIETMPLSDEESDSHGNLKMKKTQAQMHTELCEVRIRTQREYAKMVAHSKKMMDIYLDTLPQNAKRGFESTKYVEEERSVLLNEYNSLLYFLKYILSDVEDREQCEQMLEIIEGTKESFWSTGPSRIVNTANLYKKRFRGDGHK